MSDRRIEKMTGQDWLWPVLFLLMGAGGAFAAHHYFFQAFPEASVDLRLTGPQIEQKALDFLRGRGLKTDGYHVFTAFSYDDTAKTYLEREMGTEEANRLMAGPVRIWNWRTRLIKPPEKEELTVHLTTTGELMGFSHVVDEKAAGASLSKTQAQRVAEVFLRTERRIDLGHYRLVEDAVKTRPNRLDYTLTWEENGFKVKDATHRLTVTVIGDQVGGLSEFLKIPDQWTRDYEKLRSRNNLLQIIATAAYVLLLGGSIFVIFTGGRIRKIHWKAALAVGAVIGVLMSGSILNQMSIALQSMPTQSSYGTLQALIVISAVLAGVFSGMYVMVLAASGEPLYRETNPQHVAFNKLFTMAGLRTKEFFTATLIGYGMAGMHIGLVVLFYMFARQFGAWAPMEVNYDNTVSTTLPWLSPLAMASFAASSEEFGFRLFAIPLIIRMTSRWTNTRWIAVLVTAFLWGFLHSSYPQQPAWIRGVEVGLIGVVAGWVFLNFGILATLVWHYTVDAVLMGMFLLRSDNLTFKIAGVLVGDAVLIPLLISLVFYLESRGFVSDKRILNSADPEAPPLSAAVDASPQGAVEPKAMVAEKPAAPEGSLQSFLFIRPATMRMLVGAGVVLLVAGALVGTRRAGRRIIIEATPQAAEQAAIEFLRQKGVAVDQYRHVTSLQNATNGTSFDYLVEKSSVEKATGIYRDQMHAVSWRTRFFRELQKDEYSVITDATGKVERYVHTLAEDAAGAKLEEHAAMALAESAVARSGVVLADYKLVDHHLEVRKNRSDHDITWETKDKLAGEATHRISVEVKGDEVNGPRHFVKIPEDWQREHERQTIRQIVVVLVVIAFGLTAIVLAAMAIPRVAVYWRLHMTLGGLAAGLRLIEVANEVPSWSANYDTAVPWSNAVTVSALSGLMQIMFVFLGITALGVLAEVLLRDRFGNVVFWPPSGPERARAMLEGLVAGLCAGFILEGSQTIVRALLERIPSAVRGAAPGVSDYSVAFWPGLSLLLAILVGALTSTLLGAAALGTALRAIRNKLFLALTLAASAAIMAGAASSSPLEFVKHYTVLLVTLAVVAVLVNFLRFNAFSYAVCGFVAAASKVAVVWMNPGLHAYAVQALIGITMVVIAYIAWIRRELAS